MDFFLGIFPNYKPMGLYFIGLQNKEIRYWYSTLLMSVYPLKAWLELQKTTGTYIQVQKYVYKDSKVFQKKYHRNQW